MKQWTVRPLSPRIALTSASREQATGVEEVNRAVTQMDQVTTQNASLVDEASAGTHALADQAKTLSEIVSFFNLGTPVRKAVAPMYEKFKPGIGADLMTMALDQVK